MTKVKLSRTIVLLTLAVNWPYTNLLMDLASSTGMAIAWRSLMALVLVAGAIASAMLAAEFRPVAGHPALWMRSLAGGAMMGAGSVLVPGGNDTMLLVGLPLLLTSFALAYLAMSAVVALCVAVTHGRPGPPPPWWPAPPRGSNGARTGCGSCRRRSSRPPISSRRRSATGGAHR